MSLGFDNSAASFDSWQVEMARAPLSGCILPAPNKTNLLFWKRRRGASDPCRWDGDRKGWDERWVSECCCPRGSAGDHGLSKGHKGAGMWPQSCVKTPEVPHSCLTWQGMGFLISSYWSFPGFGSLQAGLQWETLWGRGNLNHRCLIYFFKSH